jgi:hypothetical protein
MQPRRRLAQGRDVLGEAADCPRRRQGRPMRRRHALHPPALLIDQDRHPALGEKSAELTGQRLELAALDAIAPEEDEARRRPRQKEGALGLGEARSGKSDDGGPDIRRIASPQEEGSTTKQSVPSACKAAQTALAPERSANGPAWRL